MPGIIALLIITYLLWRLIVAGPSSKDKEDRAKLLSEDLVQDPVCGLYLPENDALKIKDKGEEIYFCSEECKKIYLEKGDSEK